MIRINRRLLLVSLIVIPVVAISLFAVNRFQVARQGAFFVAQGKKLILKGDYQSAASNYQRAESLGKRNFEVYSELARCLKALGNHKASVINALKAEQYKSGDVENARLLAEESLALERFDDALKYATESLALNPTDSELLLLRAKSNVFKREFQSAINDYVTVLALPNPRVTAFLELAHVYSVLQQPTDEKQGEEIIDRLIADKDAPLENWLAHGEWYLRQFQKRKIMANLSEQEEVERLRAIAVKDADEMVIRYPDSSDPSEFAIRVARMSNDYAKAMELSKVAIERFPNAPAFYELASTAALESRRHDLAQDYLQRGLSRFPTENRLLLVLALLQIEMDEVKAGQQTVEKLEKSGFDLNLVDYLKARLLAADGKYLDAAEALQSLRQQFASSPEIQKQLDIELARCYRGIGSRDQQISTLRRACSADSGWLAAREELAIALLEAGRVDEATEEYRVIAERYQRGTNSMGVPIDAVLNLVRLLVMKNLGRESESRDWSAVDGLLKSVEEEVGTTEEIVVLRAESLLARKRVEEARALLASADPSESILAAQIMLEVKQNEGDKADTFIHRARELQLDSTELRRAETFRLMLDNKPSFEDRIAVLATAPEEWTTDQQLELLQKMLNTIGTTRGMESSSKLLAQSIKERQPSDLNSRLILLDIAFRNKDVQSMDDILIDIENISGQSALWHYATATRFAVSDGDFKSLSESTREVALDHLADAARIRPEWADVPALSGDIYYDAGDIDRAVAKYRQAIELGWRRLETIQRVVGFLFERGQFTDVDAVIRRLSQLDPALSSSMSRVASQASYRLENYQRAIVLAESAARSSEDSGQAAQASDDYIWLARLKEITGDKANAEAALHKSMELDPTNLKAKLDWVRFLERDARVDEARESMKGLESDIPITNASQILMLAENFAQLGMLTEAGRTARKIEIKNLTNSEECDRFFDLYSQLNPAREQRLAFLSSLIPKDTIRETRSQDRARLQQWARRKMAMELINETSNPDYENAIKLVKENSKEGQSSRDDRRTLGLIYVAWENPSKALDEFESLIQGGWKPLGQDLFLLGELYLANNNWSKANSYFLEFLANPELRKPEQLKRYASILIQREDLIGAEAVVDLLRGKRGANNTAVQDLETAGLLAEVRYRRKQLEELFRALLGEDLSKPEVEWFVATVPTRQRFEMMTAYLTKLKNDGEEEAFQKYNGPWEQMGLKLESIADFPGAFYSIQLLERKEYANAITALERVITSVTTDELASFADSLLTTEGVATDHLDRLDQLITKLDRPQDASELLIISARLKETRGEYSVAERIYRGILESNPENAVALNNLANLLALKEQNLDEALAMVNRAIELETANDPKKAIPMLLDTRGVCHLASQDLKAALSDLNKAVSQFPHPLLQFHLALALNAAGDLNGAQARLESARKSGFKPAMLHVLERDKYTILVKVLIQSPTQ